MLNIKTILHPTDFSEYSNHAFGVACALARDHGAQIVILHVAEPPMVGTGDGLVVLPPPVDLESLRKRLEQLQPDSAIPVECRLVQGNAVMGILEVAQETKCDLIVMGTHGRTGLGRLLIGSVAEQVVRRASCAVLNVKKPMLEATVAPEASPTQVRQTTKK